MPMPQRYSCTINFPISGMEWLVIYIICRSTGIYMKLEDITWRFLANEGLGCLQYAFFEGTGIADHLHDKLNLRVRT